MDVIEEEEGSGGRSNLDREIEAVSPPPPLLRLSFACPVHPDLIPVSFRSFRVLRAGNCSVERPCSCKDLGRKVATTQSMGAGALYSRYKHAPLQDHPLATHCEPSALYCWILEILYCNPKGRKAFSADPVYGRAKCLPMLGSLKT